MGNQNNETYFNGHHGNYNLNISANKTNVNSVIPLDTGRKLKILCTFNLRPVSRVIPMKSIEETKKLYFPYNVVLLQHRASFITK